MAKSVVRDLVSEAHKGAAGAVGRLSLMLASGRLRIRSLTDAAADLEEASRALRDAVEEAQKESGSSTTPGTGRP